MFLAALTATEGAEMTAASTRTILVHLNIELPDDSPATVADIAHEVRGALDVGADSEETPALYLYGATITLAEEV